MNNNKEIKMNFKKETKRCMMPRTYSDFKQMISKCYGIPEKEIPNMTVSYTDDEEDKVLITSDFDFDQALIFMDKQKINILRINIDLPEKIDNFEIIDKFYKNTENTNMNVSLDKSLQSNCSIVEERKESPKDLNNQTISSIRRDTERSVNKMNEICNKIENMTIVDKVEKIPNFIPPKEEININKQEVKESIVENSVNNIENALIKLKASHNSNFEIQPISNNKNKKKHKKEKKSKEIQPIFSFPPKEQENEKDLNSEIKNFESKMKESVNKMLDEKLLRIKQKLIEKTIKKSKKLLEKFINKKKKSTQDLEAQIKPPTNLIVHTYVTCDGCGVSPIQGIRYKCAVCNDFDYCSKCEEKNKDSHPHPFILIRHPDRAPHSITCVVKETCPIIQKSIPFNQEYKLADAVFNNVNNTTTSNSVIQKNDLSSECLTDILEISANEGSKELIKTIKLKNNGQKSWPKPVYLTCLTTSSNLTGNSVPIKLKVDPGKENNIEIKLVCKESLKAGEYESVWQLQTEKKEFFGEKVVLKIKVSNVKNNVSNSYEKVNNQQPNDLSSKNNSKMIIENEREEIFDSFVYQCQIEEMRKFYNLSMFDDKTIKEASIQAKGDVDMTFQILMSKMKK